MKFIIKINAYYHLRKILIMNPVSPELEMGYKLGKLARKKRVTHSDYQDYFNRCDRYGIDIMRGFIIDIQCNYEAYIRLERAAHYIRQHNSLLAINFIVMIIASIHAYEGNDFNSLSNKFSSIRNKVMKFIKDPIRFDFENKEIFENSISEIKKFEKKAARNKKIDDRIMRRILKDPVHQKIKREAELREKRKEKKWREDQIANKELREKRERKILGLKNNEEINPKKFNRNQRKIWKKMQDESNEEVRKLMISAGFKDFRL